MACTYTNGESPMPGDLIDMGHGHAGASGRVVVVVGGAHAGAVSGYNLAEWEYLGEGVLVQSKEMGLVFDAHPNDSLSLVKRQA